MMKPPTNAPTVDPRVARALDAVSPQHRVTFITPEARGPGVVQARPANAPRPEARDEREAPDEGTVLHRARRGDGTELRVSLHSYNGHPFLRVGLWQPPRAGEGPWWPVKGRSVTVRMREALGVAGALARSVAAAEGSDAGG